MRPVRPGRDVPTVSTALWDVSTPVAPGRLRGVTMAGFRERVDHVDIQVVPHPAVTLIVDVGDELHVEDADGRRQRGSVVAGLAPDGVHGGGRGVECLQVRLSPVLAARVVGEAPEASGAVVALDDILGPDAARIEARLRAAGSWDERFSIAEDALARRVGAGRTVDPEIAFAWEQMVTTRGQVRVDQLAEQLGWSRKRLWTRFRSQIGLTPKRAAQLVRFDHAAHRLAAGERAAEVAAEAGYADQSHLNREVASFVGVTPTAVADAPWLGVDDVAWTET